VPLEPECLEAGERTMKRYQALAAACAAAGARSPVAEQAPASPFELWDVESWHALVAVPAQFARDTGALVYLQYALNFLATATCSPVS
jgi:hypothetical protein